MSGRTLHRVGTAGLLVLALASSSSPVLGQSPNLSRGQALETAPAPRPKTVNDGFKVRLTWTYNAPTIPTPPQPAPPLAEPVMPAPVFQYQPTPAKWQQATTDQVPPPGPGVAVVTAARHAWLLGTWYRELPGMVVSVSFTPDGNGLTARITLNNNEDLITITLTGDCAVTADGTVHGVVTGADLTARRERTFVGMELAQFALGFQLFVDQHQPFAFRCRAADGGLMVSNLRVSGIDGEMREFLALLAGKYQAAGNGPVPTPKPDKLTPVSSGPCESPINILGGAAIKDKLTPVSSGPCNVGFPPASATPTMPTCQTAYQPPAPSVAAGPTSPRPAPPAEVFGMMAGTFGQMVGVPPSGPGMAVPCPAQPENSSVYPLPPAPAPTVVQPTSPYPNPPTVFGPVPCPIPVGQVVGPVPTLVPSPSPTASAWYVASAPSPTTAPITQQGQLPVGTWVRKLGPTVLVLTIKDGYLTGSVSMAAEPDGKQTTLRLIVSADCFPRQNGAGIVGVITGLDIELDGPIPDDEFGFRFKDLKQAQKVLSEKPFALTVRVYDDVLVIGSVQLSIDDSDGKDSLCEAIGMISGRYKLSTGPLPKPKRMRSGETVFSSGMTLPSASYLEHTPQYFPADPTFPLPRELATPCHPEKVAPVATIGGLVGGAAGGAIGLSTLVPQPPQSPPLNAQVVSPMTPPEPLPAQPPEMHAACPQSTSAAARTEQAAQPGKMSLADVVALTRVKVSDNVICNQIRITDSSFTLTVADIQFLKGCSVSDSLITNIQSRATSSETLSQADVVTLTRLKVCEEIIRNQIILTQSKFVLTVADLQFLKTAGVVDSVIVKMQDSNESNDSGPWQSLPPGPPSPSNDMPIPLPR